MHCSLQKSSSHPDLYAMTPNRPKSSNTKPMIHQARLLTPSPTIYAMHLRKLLSSRVRTGPRQIHNVRETLPDFGYFVQV